jgi:TAG lipase/steryl ester hydrolase/phospholipase A2/LPA acyltransferase
MSLLSDTIFAGGSTRLHVREGQHGQKSLKKSKSHAAFLGPLAHLIRNPVGSLTGTLDHGKVPEPGVATAEATRRQVLYLRMKDVGCSDWWYPLSHANHFTHYRPKLMTIGKPLPPSSTS